MHTDLIKDTIFIDGKFAGVALPFYDGKTLELSMDLSYKKRVDLSFELVRNTRELTGYFIYPTDFKNNNIMIVDGHIKLIDLDDQFTKVRFRFSNKLHDKCIRSLDLTIKSFLKDFNNLASTYLINQIGKKMPPVNSTYDGINSYLYNKSKKYPYIIISDSSDIYSNIRLLRDSRVRVIYTYNYFGGYDVMCHKISRFNEIGISIYDAVINSKIDEYLQNVLYSKIINIEGDKVLEKNKVL